MGWTNDQFTGTLTIPTGATTGARIVLDGTTGRIEVYDATNALVYVIDGTIPGATAGTSGGPQVEVTTTAGGGVVRLPTGDADETVPSQIGSATDNGGAANEQFIFQVSGPQHTGGERVSLQLLSEAADGSVPARMQLIRSSPLARLLTADRFQTQVLPQVASANSALYVNAPAGHTGRLLRTQLAAADRFSVDNTGVCDVYGQNTFATYTPAVTGEGTATWTTRTGRWTRIGKMIYFTAYLVVNAAGSGAAAFQIDTPTSIDRNTRQIFALHAEGITAGKNGAGTALVFASGSGATIDRLRDYQNLNILGSNLLAGATLTIEGWYREA